MFILSTSSQDLCPIPSDEWDVFYSAVNFSSLRHLFGLQIKESFLPFLVLLFLVNKKKNYLQIYSLLPYLVKNSSNCIWGF